MAELTALCELDTNGAVVPIWRPKAYTHGGGGGSDIVTTTIVQPADTAAGIPEITWVRTYTYSGANRTGDSGWVKQ